MIDEAEEREQIEFAKWYARIGKLGDPTEEDKRILKQAIINNKKKLLRNIELNNDMLKRLKAIQQLSPPSKREVK